MLASCGLVSYFGDEVSKGQGPGNLDLRVYWHQKFADTVLTAAIMAIGTHGMQPVVGVAKAGPWIFLL